MRMPSAAKAAAASSRGAQHAFSSNSSTRLSPRGLSSLVKVDFLSKTALLITHGCCLMFLYRSAWSQRRRWAHGAQQHEQS